MMATTSRVFLDGYLDAFFLGYRDHWVPPETSVAYFEALVAPSKKLVWFEESGHEPFVDEPAKFKCHDG